MFNPDDIAMFVSHACARFTTRKAADRAAQMARDCLGRYPAQKQAINTVNVIQFNQGEPVESTTPFCVLLMTVNVAMNEAEQIEAIDTLLKQTFLINCNDCISDGEVVVLPDELLNKLAIRSIRNIVQAHEAGMTGDQIIRRTNSGAPYAEPIR